MASTAAAAAAARLLSSALRPFRHRSPSPFHYQNYTLRFLSSTSQPPRPPSTFTNTTASFDWSSDDDESDQKPKTTTSPLPPPYNPFKPKTPKARNDPQNLQEVFHNMRAGGLTDYAVKMFDGLSKMGLTHEALELFSHIKDKASMPDVIAHTAVLEAYADARGHAKELLRTYERMLASGVAPNAYTYAVLVRGLAKDGILKDMRRYAMEMLEKKMLVDAETYVSVFEAYVREGKEEEGREFLEEMKGLGFVADEKAVREQLGRRGLVFRKVMSLLFGK